MKPGDVAFQMLRGMGSEGNIPEEAEQECSERQEKSQKDMGAEGREVFRE